MSPLTIKVAGLTFNMTARPIKKYANRRLYDSRDSRYVCTSDIYDMLTAGEVVTITDARSGNDITRPVLLNILAEAELDGKKPILSQQMLSQLLSYNDDVLAGFLGNYLEQCLDVFIRNEDVLHASMQNFDRPSPYELIEQMVNAQQDVFNQFA
ncbi:hypothetical protein KRX19_06080 [Cardiobacteriaceae bacterium TAE3-ERU3]|nr:hypothetical protein [Cardiobacteriaceae bacterium TAE3-ERU3]